MQLNKKTYYNEKLSALIILVSLIFSCKKSSVEETIPNVPVNFTVYLNLPEYYSLNSINGFALIDGQGYRGIIIYRKSLTEFVSFDRACPYDPTATGAKLNIDSSGVTTVDPHCGSKFNLYDGIVLHGPATRPMKAYNSDYDATNSSVYIYN